MFAKTRRADSLEQRVSTSGAEIDFSGMLGIGFNQVHSNVRTLRLHIRRRFRKSDFPQLTTNRLPFYLTGFAYYGVFNVLFLENEENRSSSNIFHLVYSPAEVVIAI